MYRAAPMIYLFVALWALLGLTVFFVAMRGGPRGARESLHTESKVGQRIVWAVVALAFVAGLAIPTLVLAFNGSNKDSVVVGGVKLTAQEQHGRVLFSQTCAVCHTLAATKSEGKVGPNLDVRLGAQIATESGRRALVESAISEGRARGNGDMPAGLYQGRDAEAIAAFLAAAAGH
jgi:mono/diheme cytochrome c family protein